jgi:adenosylcobinamide-GDP ribazoletransferase
VKYGALASIKPGALLVVLPLAAVAGRAAMIYVMYRFPYARETGLGKSFKEHVGPRDILVSLALLIALSLVAVFFSCPFYLGFATIIVAVLFCELFGFWVMKRIPGFTGDVYGATCELTEAIVLSAAVVLLRGFA